MNYPTLLSLTVGMSLLQLASSVQAAPFSAFNKVSVIGSLEGSSSGSGADMTLNKARWSLPSCPALKSDAPAKVVEEEEFETPAGVEAKERALKKNKKTKSASVAPTANQSQPAEEVSSEAETSAVKATRPEAPFVRLTLTPGVNEEKSQPAAKIAKKAFPAPAPVQINIPSVDPSAMDSQSSVSSKPDYTTAPAPGNGAPLPGGSSGTSGGNIRPSKTAAKGNTQANATSGTKDPKPRV